MRHKTMSKSVDFGSFHISRQEICQNYHKKSKIDAIRLHDEREMRKLMENKIKFRLQIAEI